MLFRIRNTDKVKDMRFTNITGTSMWAANYQKFMGGAVAKCSRALLVIEN